jgi:hypothetical protein
MNEYYSYHPEFFAKRQDKEIFNTLYESLVNICKPMIYNFYGNVNEGKRASCLFSGVEDLYPSIPCLLWDEAPKELINMKDMIFDNFNKKIDYLLVHIYRDWDDKIVWHSDKEAIETDVFSVSLGDTRRFIMKEKYSNKKDEFMVKNGDLFHMFGPRGWKKGCQDKYVHCVPEMAMKDMLYFIDELGLKYNGPKRKNSVLTYMKENELKPIRINLTFRQFAK